METKENLVLLKTSQLSSALVSLICREHIYSTPPRTVPGAGCTRSGRVPVSWRTNPSTPCQKKLNTRQPPGSVESAERLHRALTGARANRKTGRRSPGHGSSSKGAESPPHPPSSLQCKHTEPPRVRTHNQPSSSWSPHRPVKGSRPWYHSTPSRQPSAPGTKNSHLRQSAAHPALGAMLARPLPGAGPGREKEQVPTLSLSRNKFFRLTA